MNAMSRRLRNLLIGAAAAFGVYLLAGFFAVPALVKSQLVSFVEQKLGHKLTVGEVRFNPLRFTAEINDLALQEANGGALVAFRRLYVDFEARSLIDRAWTFAELVVEQPALKVELRPGGVLNFSALLEALRDPEKKESGPLPALKLRRIAIVDGTLDLSDRDQPAPAELRLAPIGFELTDLSTAPDHRSPYSVTARTIAGETIEWGGEVSLVPVASSGKLGLKGWKVATLAAFLGERLNVAPPSGQFDAAASYSVRYGEGRLDASVEGLELKLDDLSIAEPGAAKPLLALTSFAVTGANLDLAKRSVTIARVSADGPRADLAIDASGNGNWARLVRAIPGKPASAESASSSAPVPAEAPARSVPAPDVPPWSVKVDALTVAGAGVEFTQANGPVSLSATGGALALAIEATFGTQANIALQGVEFGAAKLAARVGEDRATLGKLAARSSGITLTPDAGGLTAAIADAALEIAQFAAQPAGSKIEVGTIDSATASAKRVVFARKAASPDLTAEGAALALGKIVVREPAKGRELARLATARVEGATIRLADRRVDIARIALTDGAVSALLDAQGRLDWAALAGASPAAPAGPARSAAAAPAKPSAKPSAGPMPGAWQVAVKDIEVKGLDAAYADQSGATPLEAALLGITARASNVGTDPKTASRIELAARVKSGGQVRIAGQVRPFAPAADLTVKVNELALAPVQPFLTSFARLQLVSGTASADGKLRYGGAGKAGPQLLYEGAVGIARLQLDETDTRATFLAFDSVATPDLKLTLGPDRVDIGELRVDGLAAKLLIAEDQSVNLTKILNRPPEPTKPAASPAAPAAAPTQAAPAEPAAEPFPVSIARIRVDRSRLEFEDLGLRPQFSTRMHDLRGVVTGVSTARTSRARVQLEGRVDEFGLARIEGEILPFQPRVFTDIAMTFRNLEMTSLTPYSAKFAGYRIASGTLSLDLQYKIRDSKLAAENKFVLDKLELGERVESPTALSLPLGLAIALLKDSNGRIDIGLPISGSLEDPEFSYGHLIWKAIGNLLTRIVTAPFRLLASLFGGSDEKLDSVEFDAGSARVLPPERQKLRNVAEALKKRPQLKLGVKPAYAKAEDAAALQSLLVRLEVVGRMGIKLEAGEDPGPVDPANPRAQQAIEALAKERLPAEALAALRAEHAKAAAAEKKTEPKPAPADPGKLHQAMLDRLIAAAPIDAAALADLAKRRGEAIARELTGPEGIEATRVTVAEPQIAPEATAKAVRSALELTAAR